MQEVFEKIIRRIEVAVKSSDNSNFTNGLLSAQDIIKQEAEQYNNGWIPCSERLPEDKQTCLVTARIYFTPDHVDEIDNYIGVGIDTYSKQFGWLGTEPIAWQPLPDPYQPVSNGSTDAGTRYEKSAWRDLILRNFMRGSDA